MSEVRSRSFRVLDPGKDRPAILGLLQRAVPGDYLLHILDRWLVPDAIIGGFERGELRALERLDDLGGGEGWLGAMRVDPDHRKEGWGRELTRSTMDLARERGISTIRLTIEDDNVASQALSRAVGILPVLAMTHVVGRASTPEGEPSSWGPSRAERNPPWEELAGVRAMRGYLLASLPVRQRFVRARGERFLAEAREGRMFQAGEEGKEGLFLLSPPGPPRDGRSVRTLVPLGTDVLRIFRAASVVSVREGVELDGFLAREDPGTRKLAEAGWTSSTVDWGARLHLYEGRT